MTCFNRDRPAGFNTLITPYLLSVIFNSRVIMETFLSEFDVIKGDGSENNQAFESTQEDKDRSIGAGSISLLNAECVFSQRVGDLIIITLEHCEQFRTTTEFSCFVNKVFAICETCIENPAASNHMSKYISILQVRNL